MEELLQKILEAQQITNGLLLSLIDIQEKRKEKEEKELVKQKNELKKHQLKVFDEINKINPQMAGMFQTFMNAAIPKDK